jgi:Zn-dependent protease with chaperone function
VSPAAEPSARALPFLLGVIAGATDIIGFLGLGGLFTAHITGNLVVLAAHIVAGPWLLCLPMGLALLALAMGPAGGAGGRQARRWPVGASLPHCRERRRGVRTVSRRRASPGSRRLRSAAREAR